MSKYLYKNWEGVRGMMYECFELEGKVVAIGNGGSMAEASHFSEEFISLGYPVIALSDASVITALANDFGYENVFSKYVKAITGAWDLLIIFSTSGKSKNCINAIKTAEEKNTVAIVEFPRRGKTTEEIQNNQLKDIHKLYESFKRFV